MQLCTIKQQDFVAFMWRSENTEPVPITCQCGRRDGGSSCRSRVRRACTETCVRSETCSNIVEIHRRTSQKGCQREAAGSRLQHSCHVGLTRCRSAGCGLLQCTSQGAVTCAVEQSCCWRFIAPYLLPESLSQAPIVRWCAADRATGHQACMHGTHRKDMKRVLCKRQCLSGLKAQEDVPVVSLACIDGGAISSNSAHSATYPRAIVGFGLLCKHGGKVGGQVKWPQINH